MSRRNCIALIGLALAVVSCLAQGGEPVRSGWKARHDWKGKSIYKEENGVLAIQRPDADDGAGAWESAPLELGDGSFLFAGGELKVTNVEKSAEITLQFYDGQGKRFASQIVASAKGTGDWKKEQQIVDVPAGARQVRMLNRLMRRGEALFRNLFLSDKAPEAEDNCNDAPFLLNGSFESADFSPAFADCFTVVYGQSRRVEQAFHGFHALELSPASAVAYGGENIPAISVGAGETLRLSFAASGSGKAVCALVFLDANGGKTGDFELSCEPGGETFRQAGNDILVPAGTVACSLTLKNAGTAPMVIDAIYLGRNSFSAEKTPTVPVITQGEAADFHRFPKSTLEPLNGRPTWRIDGKELTQAGFTLSRIREDTRPSWYHYARNVLQHGLYPLVVVECSVTPEPKGEKYTIDTVMQDIDVQVRTTLAEIPDAKIMLWVFLEPSNVFAALHPDDLTRLEDPTLPWARAVPPYSYGSEIWARQCQRVLREMIARVSRLPYADRIAAVSPGLGMYGENNFGHATTRGNRHSPQDFSPVMQDFFRKWLMREYGGNVLRFRKAWNRAGVFNFTNAQVPSMMRRVPKEKGAFYDPAHQRQDIDYVRCESFSILHRVLQMCQAVKEASGGRLFTMAQLAYFTNQIYHLELDMALKSPYLDALGPAPPYINRGPGDDIMDHGPSESASEHGKLWMFQADVRSHLSAPHNWKYGRTSDEQESIAVYLRDIGHYMSRGQIPYYMTFERWYDSPGLLELISRFNGWLALGARFPRQSNAEIAVVVDPMSLATGHEYSYVRRIMPPYQSSLEYNRTFEWHHLGAPYDFFMLDDLLQRQDIKQYKVVIFAANWAMSREQRERIEKRLKRDGRTLIWLFAPGLLSYDKDALQYSLDGTKITGFDFTLSEKVHNLEITLADGQKVGCFNTKIYGGFRTPQTAIAVRPETFAPRLSVKPGPGVEILGVYSEDQAPAAARRRTEHHTDVFWGSTALNKEALLPMLMEAGVHLYTDKPAVVYASENILAIHTPTAGKRQVFLPREAECVRDLFANKALASNVRRFDIDMAKNSTLLLYYGEKSRLSNALAEVEAEESQRQANNARELSTGKYTYVLPSTSRPLRGQTARREQVYHPDTDGFIREYLFVGPFPGYEKERYNFDVDFIQAEATGAIDASAKYDVVFDARAEERVNERLEWFNGAMNQKALSFGWRPVSFSSGVVKAVYEEIPLEFSSFICYYLACYVSTPVERTLRLSIGSDDGEKTWLNGVPVTSFFAPSRGVRTDSEGKEVTLRPGKNLLLVKVVQGLGGVGHAVRFLNPQNNQPVTDLDITLP
ncbi:MAG: hypothetical protein IJJ33_21215 [Victivallales bacterium]|nr:hypothetical protein [Victivallales bacterium]